MLCTNFTKAHSLFVKKKRRQYLILILILILMRFTLSAFLLVTGSSLSGALPLDSTWLSSPAMWLSIDPTLWYTGLALWLTYEETKPLCYQISGLSDTGWKSTRVFSGVHNKLLPVPTVIMLAANGLRLLLCCSMFVFR